MPIAKYNRYFGGEKGSAAKALKSMEETYRGTKKAKNVFYALINKKKQAAGGHSA